MGFTPFNAPPDPWLPSDDGWLAASADPASATATVLLTAGTQYLARLQFRAATLVSTLTWIMTTSGAGASSGSFGALISPAGLILAQSADIGAALAGAAGKVPAAMTVPYPMPAGSWAWALLLANLAVTQPTMARQSASSLAISANQAGAAGFRYATNGTTKTVVTAINPASNAATANALLVFAS